MAFPSGWGRKQKITIDNTKVSGSANLTDFPMLITLDHLDSTIVDAGASSALNGGGDIRFSSDSAGTTQLACEIVNFVTDATPANRKCEIWVKVPTVNNNVDTDIYIWYSKTGETQPAVTTTYGRNAVWVNEHSVYHLENLTNSKDGTDLTLVGDVNSTTGKIGNAYNFDGTGADYLEGSGNWNKQKGSIRHWFKADQLRSQVAVYLSDGVTATYNGFGSSINLEIHTGLESSGGNTRFDLEDGGSTKHRAINHGTGINTSNFYHFAATWDKSGNMKLFIDGVLRTTADISSTAFGDAIGTVHKIGATGNNFSDRSWDGVIDQVFIGDNIEYTEDWIQTEYNNQSGPDTFASAGTPELLDPYWDNVSLLLHADEASAPYIDSSSNNYTVSNNNVITSDTVKKFGSRSFEFTSPSTYLTVANNDDFFFGTGAFTIELWFNISKTGVFDPFISTRSANSNSDEWKLGYNHVYDRLQFYVRAYDSVNSVVEYTASGIGANTWHHLAVTRDESNNTRMFIDGTMVNERLATVYDITNSNGYPLAVGQELFYAPGKLVGYLDEIRITKGTARYLAAFTPSTEAFPGAVSSPDQFWSNVVLLTHFDNDLVDVSSSGHVASANSGETLVSSVNNTGKFEQAALFTADQVLYYKDGTSDFQFGTGDFTVEGWIKQSSSKAVNPIGGSYNYNRSGGGSGNWLLYVGSNRLILAAGATGSQTTLLQGSTANVSASDWVHVAVSRQGTSLKLFVDGNEVGELTSNSTDFNDNGGVTIGNYLDGGNTAFDGHIDEVRITKGVARYTSSFTPPTEAFGDTAVVTNPNEVPSELSIEEVQDIVGGMVTGNTETGVSVTYDDVNGKLDFDVNEIGWSDVTGKPTTFTPSVHTHGWVDITGKPSTFAPSSHDHDGRYYTETEVDTALALKANASHTHAASDIVSGTFSDARYAATSNAKGTRTVSTSTPSGGSNGDIWMEV